MPGDFTTLRETAPSDAGEEDLTLQDPENLISMLRMERRMRLESELKRKEAEDEKYELEKLQKEQEGRYVPVTMTPDLLARTISESIRQVNKGGSHRSHIRMPAPGSAGAPETFKGTSAKLLPEFFRRFELCLAEAEINEEGEMLNHLLKYVGVTVGEWIQNQTSFKQSRYDDLKSALLALYNNPERGDPYTVKDLTVLAMEYARTEVTHQDALSERLMVFDTMASKLIESKKLNETDRDQLFFKTFTPARREAIWEHLSKTEPWHPRKEPFSMRQVCKAAKYLIEGRFDDDIEGDPRPTGQRLLDEVKKLKEAEKAEPEKKSGDLYEVIRKMQKLSLQDPVYESHYAYLMENFPDAAKLVTKPDVRGPPADRTYVMQTREWRQGEWPRNKCFYCGGEGCSMGRCPHLTKDITDGLVIKEGLTLMYKNRERLYRKDDGIRADVLARRAREVAERNSTSGMVKDRPPHQTNICQIIEDDQYEGYYIGIQECEPTEVDKVNIYTESPGEELLVSRAESYYMELVEEGVSDDEATEVAWSMANLRSGSATKGREARESAKPYDKENRKGKGKAVRFAEPPNPAVTTPQAASPQPPVAPAPRFPPSAPMPAQPVPIPKPAARDWPRTVPNVAIPVVAYPQAPKASVPFSKPLSIPEIDMTAKEVGPKYRFTSDVEEMVSAEKTIDRLLGDVKLTVGLTDLLALSPAMRKRLSEMTKTKRVPSMDVVNKPKNWKVAVAHADLPEDDVYMSSNVVEAVVDRNPRYSAALPRVQTEINGVAGVGMMDTGSQINIMTEEFWMKTSLPINEGRKIKMQGVNLIGDQSIGLCEGVEVPFGSVTTRAHFHVFRKAPYSFILGQPWIQDHLLAVTEMGHTNKILIRDFKDPKSRVTMVLRNDPENLSRGDMPTVLELSMPPIEVSAYAGIAEECVVDEEVFDQLEERLAKDDERAIQRIDALTGKAEERAPSFRRRL
jgi:hypothetical protein